MGAKAIAAAIKMPPQAMNGMVKEIPLSKCFRRFLRNSK